MIKKFGPRGIAVAIAPLPEAPRDGNSGPNTAKKRVSTGGRSWDIYPWGVNNLLVNEMIDLYRSNSDVMNLVQTRADFMYGDGPGWFKHVQDGKNVVFEPFSNSQIEEFGLLNDLEDIVNTQLTYFAETGNAFVNLSQVKGEKFAELNIRDSLTVRGAVASGRAVDTWLLASDWRNPKKAVAVPAWNPQQTTAPETIYQIKGKQSGQFYYGYPKWWGTARWIKLANRVPEFHDEGLDTEYNVSKICRVNQDFFKMFGGETDEEIAKFKDEWYDQIEAMLFNKKGQRRIIFDECTVGTDGKLQPWIEFQDIPKGLTGKEYSELYDMAIRAFANGSGILAGLVGVNDGKMLGGSGSELRVSAEYQQFYRTPRDRQAVISFFNRVIKPMLSLPKEVHFGFKNILLETLDKSKAGSSQQTTSTTSAAKDATKRSK